MTTREPHAAVPAGRINPLNKGIGFLEQPIAHEEIAQRGWNLLREDLTLPAAVLCEEKLRHNLDWMRQFVVAYGVNLAPHGKTTMAPRLFAMQLEAGAWGITLATAHQTEVAYAYDVRRVLMANQLIGLQNMATISHLLRDPTFEFYCLVDSVDQINQLGSYYSRFGQRLNVLIELGVDGGRAGVRNGSQLLAALNALGDWSESLVLCGVEIYEGVLDNEASIRAFLHRAVGVTNEIAAKGLFQRKPILLSGAGSAWYDVVAEVFSEAGIQHPVEIVLRPGCYLTHDIGAYRVAQTRIQRSNAVARKMSEGLKPALQIWAYVQSVPEAERAIVAMGKRDAAFDSGLPVPALHFRPGDAETKAAPAHWTVTRMMDQHTYLQIAAQDDLRVGDMISFDIAHPCLTFDKWRVLALVNARYDVVDLIETFF
ncbi:MAG: amino acid deaminase [Terracidiphilus sp.]